MIHKGGVINDFGQRVNDALMSIQGPLAELPLKRSDFASACFTASVPRQYLRLVLVRVLALSGQGIVDEDRCRTVAVLFDSRHSVERLCEAARNAVRTSRESRYETDAVIESTHLFTRVSGTIIPLRPTQKSVYEASIMSNGQLRGSLHVTGALRAYKRHASSQSRVCLKRAASVLARTHTPAKDSLLAAYTSGMQRLGVSNPTHVIPDDCQCTGTSECACFMWRAVWRAGRPWLIVYAIMPPAWMQTQQPPLLGSMSPPWLDRLLDASASESEDVANPLDTLSPPSRWRNMTEEAFLEALDERVSLASLSFASLDTSDASVDDDAEQQSVLPVGNMAQAAVVWIFSSSARADLFMASLTALAKHSNLYYKTSLEHVLAMSVARRRLAAHALCIAGAAPNIDDALAKIRLASNGVEAFERLVPLFASKTNAWRSTSSIVLHSCEVMGYTLIVCYALLVCCAEHSRPPTRAVNTWHTYNYCDAVASVCERQIRREIV